jgi:hypothetical protein
MVAISKEDDVAQHYFAGIGKIKFSVKIKLLKR